MAVAAAARKMNQSNHTFDDLKTFAKSNPTQATKYLTEVESKLRALGEVREANVVKKVLTDKTGTLVERVAEHAKQLGTIFPKEATDWGSVQVQRAATLGYGEVPKPGQKVASYFTGKITGGTNWGEQATFKTTGGQTLTLADSNQRVNTAALPGTWVQGFLGDGPITLKGMIGEDNKTFNVEGFALNTDGKYDSFTFGRVKQVESGARKVYIDTPRGDVEVVDKELAKKLKAMPRLGIILPGEPENRGGKLVYAGNPEEFFGLARWRDDKASGKAKGHRIANADMAYSIFSNKPIELPTNQASRVNHSGRLWAKGNVEMSGNEATKFVSTYISKQTDSGLYFATAGLEADGVQAAVVSSDTV